MMLKEIIRNHENKAVIANMIVIFTFILVSCGVQPKKENSNLVSKKIETNENAAISGSGENVESEEISTIYYGDWIITEYLGESVEYHETEETTNAEKNNSEKTKLEIKEKYLNKELHIDSSNVITPLSPTELGYYVLTWDDLFMIYRQPSDIWEGISPPFTCISFGLKDLEDSFSLILDTNGIATLVVKGYFFRLEKIVATD